LPFFDSLDTHSVIDTVIMEQPPVGRNQEREVNLLADRKSHRRDNGMKLGRTRRIVGDEYGCTQPLTTDCPRSFCKGLDLADELHPRGLMGELQGGQGFVFCWAQALFDIRQASAARRPYHHC